MRTKDQVRVGVEEALLYLGAAAKTGNREEEMRAKTRLTSEYHQFVMLADHSDPFDLEVIRRVKESLGL